MPNPFAEKTYALFANPNNVKLISELEKLEANVLKFPLMSAEKIAPDENSIELLKNLSEYDWIVFTDVLAVDFFLDSLEENGTDFFELDEMRVCALGETVSDRLRFVQLHADVIPNRIDAPSVLSALKSYAAEAEFKALKFLVVKEVSLDCDLRNELIKTRANVAELPIYRINLPVKDEITKLKTLLKGGAIDEFIFSAPTDFIALKRIFDEEPLTELLSEIKVSAVDGLTLQTVREHRIKPADLFRLQKIDTV